jgi:hypothetical protein
VPSAGAECGCRVPGLSAGAECRGWVRVPSAGAECGCRVPGLGAGAECRGWVRVPSAGAECRGLGAGGWVRCEGRSAA